MEPIIMNAELKVETQGPEEPVPSLETPSFTDEALGHFIHDDISSSSDDNGDKYPQSEAGSDYGSQALKRRNSNQVKFPDRRSPKRTRSIHGTVLGEPKIKSSQRKNSSHMPSSKPSKSTSNTQKRAFPCVFHNYGCERTFGSKNDWKRHVGSKHLQLGFFRCDTGFCNPDAESSSAKSHPASVKSYNDFNRKDLFTEHHRRMHTPWSTTSKEPSAKMKQDFENSLEDVRKRCWHERRAPPRRSTCGFCRRVFEGPNGWDERMEHVGKHFAKNNGATDVRSLHEEEDEDLREWALQEGIVRDYGTKGFWLVGMEPAEVSNTGRSNQRKVKGQQEVQDEEDIDAEGENYGTGIFFWLDWLEQEQSSRPYMIPESSSIAMKPKASENSGVGTHVAPPKVNEESITSSLSALANVVVPAERLNRTKPSKPDEAASPPVNAIPAEASRPSLGDTFEIQSSGGIDMELLSQSQKSLSSRPETDSVNSFEDDSPEDSSGDENRSATVGYWSASEGLSSENMLPMLRPLFVTLPNEVSQPLSHDLMLLFDSWVISRSLERPSHPPSSSSSAPPRRQANGSAGSSTEYTSSSSSTKKRPLGDGSESPGDGDDDKNGDETRKRLRPNSQSQEDIVLRWACPFYQKSPHYYCVETEYGDYRKCAKSPGFSGVHRVKGHIYKCHASIYCDRCYSVFKNEDDLTAHRRDPSPCTVQDPRPIQGLTNEQKKLLRPRDRNKSEEARWNTIYKICFPNDEFIPSPYYIFYSRETAELRRDVLDIVEEETRFLDNTVQDRIRERLQHAFNNIQMRSSLGITGPLTLPFSEISSQQREAGPLPPSPLASRSAVVTSIGHQAIPAVTAEAEHMALTQDLPFGDLQRDDTDDHLLFGPMVGYEDMSEIFSTLPSYK